jgi:UDP-glucose 4-epimerase
MLRQEPLKIASPDRKVDWIYVEDVVRGLLAVAAAPGLEGKSIDLGSGSLVEIRELVDHLHRLIRPQNAPEFGALPKRPFEQERCADVASTHALTGWRPAISLAEGLSRTVTFASKSIQEVALVCGVLATQIHEYGIAALDAVSAFGSLA